MSFVASSSDVQMVDELPRSLLLELQTLRQATEAATLNRGVTLTESEDAAILLAHVRDGTPLRRIALVGRSDRAAHNRWQKLKEMKNLHLLSSVQEDASEDAECELRSSLRFMSCVASSSDVQMIDQLPHRLLLELQTLRQGTQEALPANRDDSFTESEDAAILQGLKERDDSFHVDRLTVGCRGRYFSCPRVRLSCVEGMSQIEYKHDMRGGRGGAAWCGVAWRGVM